MLWTCKDCTTRMAVGIKRCPHCNRNHIDKGTDEVGPKAAAKGGKQGEDTKVAKTTAHGEGSKGTNALDPEYRKERGFEQLDPTGQKPNSDLLDDNGEVDRTGIGETGRQKEAESSPGNSSPKSIGRQESSSVKKTEESPSPAPRTAQSSKPTAKAPSTASGAAGSTGKDKK